MLHALASIYADSHIAGWHKESCTEARISFYIELFIIGALQRAPSPYLPVATGSRDLRVDDARRLLTVSLSFRDIARLRATQKAIMRHHYWCKFLSTLLPKRHFGRAPANTPPISNASQCDYVIILHISI